MRKLRYIFLLTRTTIFEKVNRRQAFLKMLMAEKSYKSY